MHSIHHYKFYCRYSRNRDMHHLYKIERLWYYVLKLKDNRLRYLVCWCNFLFYKRASPFLLCHSRSVSFLKAQGIQFRPEQFVLGGTYNIVTMNNSVLSDPPVGFSLFYGSVISGVDFGNVFSVVTRDSEYNKRGLQLFITYNGLRTYMRCVMGSTLTSWKEV